MKFFRGLVLSAVNEREVKQIVRPDMIHLLMEAKKGKHVNRSINDGQNHYMRIVLQVN